MKNNNDGYKVLKSFAVATLLALPTELLATITDNTGPIIITEEVIVTAQKREQDRQHVPLAVSVISDNALLRSGISDLPGMRTQVPSLNVIQSGSVLATTLSIRGLGTSALNAGLEPSVGVFIDDVYQSRAANVMGDLLDVKRIEVLHGPQSTLFGKNTSAGIISIITRPPEKEQGYTVSLGLGNYNSQHLQGSTTGPLSDQLFYRLSASSHQRDGFYQNTFDGSDLNDRNRWVVRGQLLFEPEDDFSLRFTTEYDAIDELCCAASFYRHQPQNAIIVDWLGGSEINTNPYSRKIAVNNKTGYEHNQLRLSLKADWEPGAVNITSISAWQDFELEAGIDSDFSDLDLASNQSIRRDNNTVLTQELRVSSNTGHSLQWMTGLYYFHQDFDHRQSATHGGDMRTFLDVFTTALVGGTPFLDTSPISVLEQAVLALPANTLIADGDGVQNAVYDLTTQSTAWYGQTDWQMTEKLIFSTGLRYTYEEKSIVAKYLINAPFSALDLSPGGAIVSINPAFSLLAGLQLFPLVDDDKQSRYDDNFSGSITLAYQFNDAANLYSSYRRGFKSGGFQVTSFIPDSGIEFDEEIVDAIELGLKLEGADQRWRANMATFFQAVSGYQIFVIENNTSVVSNASDVDISGVEFESMLQINKHISLDISATYIDTEFVDFSNGPCPVFILSQSCDLSGKSLPDVPNWTASTAVNYSLNINRFTVHSRLQYFYKGARYVAPDFDPAAEQGSARLLNASISLSDKNGAWELSLWGKNLTDEEYTDRMFDSAAFPGDHNGYPGDPRTYRLTLSLAF